ncbi:hypothetical protein WMY93_019254 [Mugilogobius chulae]|uniref:E2F transcription factor CC-MB domain-containing protein n=1 Tax=Mugilogobius chulae TaxID=88201 RepID=A0AAW0NKM0_9GOBI
MVQWVGWPEDSLDNGLKRLVTKEKCLDDSIQNAKQNIQEMHWNYSNNRFAYLTYKDIQSLPIFEDQAVFVIKAPPETKLEVAHPKEVFQIHINSTTGPVEVLVATDNSAILPRRSQRPKFADGDYSDAPLRGLSTTSCNDDIIDNAKSKTSTDSPPESAPHLSQPLNPEPIPILHLLRTFRTLLFPSAPLW